MVEADHNFIPPAERQQTHGEKLVIWATKALSRDCRGVAEKMGCEVGTVVDKILYIGDETMKAFADGKKRVVIALVDGKIVVESFRG